MIFLLVLLFYFLGWVHGRNAGIKYVCEKIEPLLKQKAGR